MSLHSGSGRLAVGLTDVDLGAQKGIVAVFNTADGKLLRILRRLSGASVLVDGVAISPDGTQVASYGRDAQENRLIVQDLNSGEVTHVVADRGVDQDRLRIDLHGCATCATA